MAISKITSDAIDATDFNLDSDTLKIDSTNNRVGIGTDSPNKTLEIKNSTSPTLRIGDGTRHFEILGGSSTQTAGIGTGYSSAFTFNINSTERMRIDSSGNVGIGTSSPTTNFQIGDSTGRTFTINQGTANKTQLINDREITLQSGSGYGTSIKALGGSGYGNITFETSNNGEVARIDSSGQVAINTTSFTNYAQTSGDSNWAYRTSNGAVIQAQDADDGFSMMYMNKFDWTSSKDSRYINWYKNGATVGSITLTSGGLINYGGTSDYRLKENVVDMTGAIDRIKQAQPKQFNMIDDPNDTTQDGFLAHELATVVPESVTGTHNAVETRTNCVRTVNDTLLEENVTEDEWTAGKTDGVYPDDSIWSASWDEPIHQMADYSKLVPLLTAALQEAVAKIETLEAKVTALETTTP